MDCGCAAVHGQVGGAVTASPGHERPSEQRIMGTCLAAVRSRMLRCVPYRAIANAPVLLSHEGLKAFRRLARLTMRGRLCMGKAAYMARPPTAADRGWSHGADRVQKGSSQQSPVNHSNAHGIVVVVRVRILVDLQCAHRSVVRCAQRKQSSSHAAGAAKSCGCDAMRTSDDPSATMFGE